MSPGAVWVKRCVGLCEYDNAGSCVATETVTRHIPVSTRRILSLSSYDPWHSLAAHLRNNALHDIKSVYCFRYGYSALKQTRSTVLRTLLRSTWAAAAVRSTRRSARRPGFSIVVSAPVNVPTWRNAEIALERFVRRWMSKCSRTNACLKSVSTLFLNFAIDVTLLTKNLGSEWSKLILLAPRRYNFSGSDPGFQFTFSCVTSTLESFYTCSVFNKRFTFT